MVIDDKAFLFDRANTGHFISWPRTASAYTLEVWIDHVRCTPCHYQLACTCFVCMSALYISIYYYIINIYNIYSIYYLLAFRDRIYSFHKARIFWCVDLSLSVLDIPYAKLTQQFCPARNITPRWLHWVSERQSFKSIINAYEYSNNCERRSKLPVICSWQPFAPFTRRCVVMLL